MMFKLYDFCTMSLLDMSSNEKDIIDSISDYIKANMNYRLKVYQRIDYTDYFYKRINCVGDYYDYVNEYNAKKNTEILKAMSCQELKREILELSDKPRMRIRKR